MIKNTLWGNFFLIGGVILSGSCCFAAETTPCLKKFTIESVALVATQRSEKSPEYTKEKLEFFYKKRLDSDKYEISARLLRGKIPIHEFENAGDRFGEIKDLCNLKHTCHSYDFYKKNQLKIEVQSDKKESKNFLLVDEVEHTGQTEELLNMPSCYPCMHSDTIVFQKAEWDEEEIATIYNPKNVAMMKALLLSWNKEPIVVTLIEGGKSSTFKIMEYSNGAYIHWQGLNPTCVGRCVGMPFSCAYGMDPSEVKDRLWRIEIDLNKDKEYLPTYQRNKWGFRAVIAAILLYGGYWLMEKLA